jgi:surfeit locus 1 family protein
MRFRPRPGLTVAALAAFVVLCGLGTWQVQRLHWKEGLIAERRAALALPPVSVTRLSGDASAQNLRRVTATGAFLHDRELHLVARTRDGNVGIEIVTPLALASGGFLLVDRGWVPQDRADPATRQEGQVAGPVTVEGVVGHAGRPNFFTPDNEPQRNVWHFVDIAAMSKAAGIAPGEVVPYIFVAGETPNPGGLPIGRAASADLPNPHLGYAITWFALAAALVAIYLMMTLTRDPTS